MSVPFSGALDNDGVLHFKGTSATTFPVIDKTEFESFLGVFSVSRARTTASATLKTDVTTLATASAAKQGSTALSAIAGTTASGQKYSVVFPSKAQASVSTVNYPQGDGYASVTVKPNGSVSVSGALADGTTYSASGKLHLPSVGNLTQSISLYTNLYTKKGAFATELIFDVSAATHASSDVLGTGTKWIRPVLPRSRYYPAGWPTGAEVDAIGARFTPPPTGSVLPHLTAATPNAQLQFADGELIAPGLTRDVLISPTNSVTNKSTDTSLKLSITKTSGVFSGAFTHPDGTKPAFKGIIIQEGPLAGGYGFFRSTPPSIYGQSGLCGGVTLVPNPVAP